MSGAVRLDPREFARLGNSIEGNVWVSSLARLSESVSAGSDIVYRLQGTMRRDGRAAIRLRVAGEVTLICQRCLGPVTFGIDASRELVFVPADRMGSIEDEGDDEDFLPLGDDVFPLELVEEECLLSLPLAAMHGAGECAGDAGV